MKKISDIFADFLEQKKIKHVFGIVGAGNVHIFDSIVKKGYTEIICVHHEQAACIAVQTYYRVTGNPTMAILTTGGGSTNGVTGVVSAWADSIPCLIISGNEHSKYLDLHRDLRMIGVQGYDSSSMVSKVTKYSNKVLEPESILFELEKAYYLSLNGRPGPCWIDIPMNIQSSLIDINNLKEFNESYLVDSFEKNNIEVKIDNLLALLSKSNRPVLWLGNGIRLANAQHLVSYLIEKLNIPTIVSWAGIDMIDSNHELVFGRAGTYGNRSANFIVQNADLIISIGTRLAIPQIGYELSEFSREAELIMVDIDINEINKLGPKVSLPIQSDARFFIELLMKKLELFSLDKKVFWLARCKKYKSDFPFVNDSDHPDTNGYINSYKFMEKLNYYFREDEIIVTDMGTALLSGHQVLKLNGKQRLMTSTGLGEMGYGLPAAIGASFATNKKEVICLNCDGGMMMNLQELQTIIHHKLPIKIFIFNNDGYLMIKHTQKSLFDGRYSGTDNESGVSCPDFEKIAKSFEIKYFKIETWKDFDNQISDIMDYNSVLFCEVFMDPEQYFYPKLSLSVTSDGKLVSPPLEDLSPLLSRDELKNNMIIPIHEKSKLIGT